MISIISSVGKNRELGCNNRLIWHIPHDMKFFKDTTMGHKVVMGTKTFDSLPGPLPGREMIVITRGSVAGAKVESSINNVVDKYMNSEEEIFIIGGATIYEQFIGVANKLYLTEIDETSDIADTFFPKFKKKEWKKTIIEKNSYNNINYKICLYEKKNV